ncbi:MAG: hypothetical protein A3E61_00530 [Candidatus Colwellbacteria bacterium RIFCSPHIGHO2_12_FULL_43_12]|uniref:Prokaryotic-type class I peptide chain release factors domain-containing protein n=3 Tax=Candidatus Colwelliibacteriota TaxID=1817904 RepID=A0A1G1Z001_9BACT|nr:MAG: hypothetical protein A3D47_01735 [Candidatus Colwellbacteria bacterium RIFCSPHIGHO2_02_FULL_43_15]OGY58504.1 MAG: hypothetical protein A3E61_00530 [Candidatus Colwellbacteria bacterium RIFCSPHIGHO2_12_FULL_43_12]OGY60997.1 MAG: hypothetical protein A3F99_01525 [Candidatus Colwellbacteria bacterium RIFCSPLOWO2_12_FULL_43_11]
MEFEISDFDLWKENKSLAEEKNKEAGLIKNLLAEFDAADTLEKLRKLEIKTLMSGAYDHLSAVISLYPGVGGEDAEDWSRMLLEMYELYALGRGWKVKSIDANTIEIKGEYAYGFLRKETGVHRLVRISPFDSKKLRHTSFALVEVLPDLPSVELSKIKIPPEDIKIEFSRSGGPGGQNVNKVETAVRVVHLPTNLSAASSSERSQSQNREKAMALLAAKIFKLMEEKQAKEIKDLRTKVKPEWGNQIRSYVLHPYKLVKDHRTETETSKADAVLAGDLDLFIESEVEKLK